MSVSLGFVTTTGSEGNEVFGVSALSVAFAVISPSGKGLSV
ncbi:hypothetical protein RCG37_09465 [Mammaliicoccus lentus]|nr:hypothetical protein [Mammaliicoccus lentus]MDQ7143278.1 hypothetical protein [Mammaliicoccus lentus]